MTITEETRRESHEKVDKKMRNRQILDILDEYGTATAKEIAVTLYQRGYTPSAERNYAAPRLSELEAVGVVQVVGKKVCAYTGKKVAVYRSVLR